MYSPPEKALGQTGGLLLRNGAKWVVLGRMNPMNTFNPEMPCHVHDKLNKEIIEWNPQWAPLYRDFGGAAG